MKLSAKNTNYGELNRKIRAAETDVVIEDCCGQRFIGSGLKDKTVTINGTPGNALGAYLDGGIIKVTGNAQDAVGDTMNDGRIIIHGNAGDALGYAMRGGQIFVERDSGYRTGIHMKEYTDIGGAAKRPVIVIGGGAGSFLGEYLAGGLIIVLGIGFDNAPVGNFTGTGMHGGRIFVRTKKKLANLPEQVIAMLASKDNMKEIAPYVAAFAEHFGGDAASIMAEPFYMLTPNVKNPYKQLYTAN